MKLFPVMTGVLSELRGAFLLHFSVGERFDDSPVVFFSLGTISGIFMMRGSFHRGMGVLWYLLL